MKKATRELLKRIFNNPKLEKSKPPTVEEFMQPCGISEVAFERTQEWQDFIKKTKIKNDNNKKGTRDF